ncbi:MAG: GIDE domain-containing protein [Myxococcota bacterium]
MGDAVMVSAFASVGGLVAFFRGFRSLRTLRRIENTPTSKIRSMPMGLVELHGAAVAEETFTGPFTGKPVVFWEATVEEYRRGRRSSHWVTVHKASSEEHPFHIEDETGRVLVLPANAETHLPNDYRESFGGRSLPAGVEAYLDRSGVRARGLFGIGKRLRFTERHIVPGQAVYIHGVAQERPDLRHRVRDRRNEILREVKASPEAMDAIDRDGDGRISDQEWDTARRSAASQARSEGVTDRVVVAKGGPRDLFLLSDRSERELVRRLHWTTGLCVFGGGAAFVAGTAFLVHRFSGFF